ncbi:hypothetical protein ACE193_17110 [Bernardetia sp. OM2101]|uniref:hypothetical protein n=1 Tax=Bernardetia sp. OM2101 TaxID=3344876 RepID=UPI0035D0E0D7
MKSIHITFINVLIVVIFHSIVYHFLNTWAIKVGACGMGLAMIAGWFLLFLNISWSSVTLVYVLSISSKKANYKNTWLFVVLGVIGNLIMALLLEYYLWALLIIPYLIFLGESFYLKFTSNTTHS